MRKVKVFSIKSSFYFSLQQTSFKWMKSHLVEMLKKPIIIIIIIIIIIDIIINIITIKSQLKTTKTNN